MKGRGYRIAELSLHRVVRIEVSTYRGDNTWRSVYAVLESGDYLELSCFSAPDAPLPVETEVSA
jgi:hypothetical protein